MFNTHIDILKNLCEIDSPSEHEDTFFKYLHSILKKLGLYIAFDLYGNMHAKTPVALAAKSTLLFACHGDKVSNGKPIQLVIENDHITSNGENILGLDNKAALSSILWFLITEGINYPLEILITRNEEEGFIGARNLDYSLIKSKIGFTMDGGIIGKVLTKSCFWDVLIINQEHNSKDIIDLFKEINPNITINAKLTNNSNTVKYDCFLENNSIFDYIILLKQRTNINDFYLKRMNTGFELNKDSIITNLIKSAYSKESIEYEEYHDVIGPEVCLYNYSGIEMVNIGDGVINEHEINESIKTNDLKQQYKIIKAIISEFHKHLTNDLTPTRAFCHDSY